MSKAASVVSLIVIAVATPLTAAPSPKPDPPLFQTRRHQALNLIQGVLVDEGLGGNVDRYQLLLVPKGWGEFKSRDRRVVVGEVGELERYRCVLDRIESRPEYDLFLQHSYEQEAMNEVHPGCYTYVEVEPPQTLPNGDLKVIYQFPRFGAHLVGPGTITLRWRIFGWNMVSRKRGTVSF